MSILDLTGAESCKECGERAQAERDRLQTENAKLRELVVALYHVHFGTEEESWDAWEDFCPCSICEERHGGEAPCAYTSKDLSDECCEPTTKEIVIDRMRELGVEV
ncbi:MAG: hypothetical protein IKG18_06990 [Atopobiaceae bacterium]|nr:hypothetical protein [Atopobiaceae bacterium]